MKSFIKPDYNNSNINISATLAEFLGAPNKNTTLPIIKEQLTKGYKNVVFICFDGFGINPVEKNLDESSFLRKNIKKVLTSTFPSTTTNATTSLVNNKLPLEHGWFGWSMNFAHLNKNVDIFRNTDSLTGETVDTTNSPLSPNDYYFDHANSEYNINSVFPSYVGVKHPERNYTFFDQTEFFETIETICNYEGKQFIYAYNPEPDSTMHQFGVSSDEAYELINSISENVEKLANTLKDTLFIITADHGQVDIEGYVNLYADKKLLDMLKIYPFLEARAPAFIVKDNKKQEFEEYFTKTYGEDFVLYKSADLINDGYFGNFGDKAHLLGDYIAIGTYTHKQALLTPISPLFKGHHTSLTEEMLVPLIIVESK